MLQRAIPIEYYAIKESEKQFNVVFVTDKLEEEVGKQDILDVPFGRDTYFS